MLTGRVHSAVVSGINDESASVTVEWFEHNETKGKQVCWYACVKYDSRGRILELLSLM